MGRVLIIAIACVIGALGTWLFVPTIQRVPVNPDMPVFNYDPDATPKADTTAPKAGVITEEKRRARAEQLIGKKLKYIVSDQLHTSAWFTEQGVQVIERALDECYLVTPTIFTHSILKRSPRPTAATMRMPIHSPAFKRHSQPLRRRRTASTWRAPIRRSTA